MPTYNTGMARRARPFRVLAVIVLLWVAGLTGARDLLHNHSGLAERQDCPACRLDGTAGVATPFLGVMAAIPDLRPVGIVPARPLSPFVSSASDLEPPPRSPPFLA